MLNCCIQRALLRNEGISSTSTENIKPVESNTPFTSSTSVSYKDYKSSAGEHHYHQQQSSKSCSSEPLSSTGVPKSPKKDASWNDLLSNLEGKHNDEGVTTSENNKKDKTWSELLSNIDPSSDNNRDIKHGVSKNSVSYSDIQSDPGSKKSEELEENELEDEDDEFFEAREEISGSTDVSMTDAQTTSVVEDREEVADVEDDANREPDGVSSETDITLLCTGKPLCVPITQVNCKGFLSQIKTRYSTENCSILYSFWSQMCVICDRTLQRNLLQLFFYIYMFKPVQKNLFLFLKKKKKKVCGESNLR